MNRDNSSQNIKINTPQKTMRVSSVSIKNQRVHKKVENCGPYFHHAKNLDKEQCSFEVLTPESIITWVIIIA